MATIIQDGTGKGFSAQVDKEHRLRTHATVEAEQHFVNENDKRYWMFPFDAVDPTDADDYFLVIKYGGKGVLVVTDIRITSTVAGFLEPQHVTGVPVNGTAVGLVNRHLGATEDPDGVYEFGVNITGLVDAGHLHHLWLPVDTERHMDLDGHFFVPPGQLFALLWTVATGVLSGSVSMYELL